MNSFAPAGGEMKLVSTISPRDYDAVLCHITNHRN
jgi:hypothetical protein